MGIATTDLIDSPELRELARRYGVYSPIHPQDFIFLHHKNNPPRDVTEAAGMYYHIGNDSATRLLSLIDRCPPSCVEGKVSVLEFAAGYGCVTRHLKLHDRLEVTPCDIHDEAVAFLQAGLGVSGLVSATQPKHLDTSRGYDVVFALSFFTHMPARTWAVWFEKLFSLVRPGGVFIFTTHGFKPWRDVGSPAIDEHGFWFAPISEQKDLSTDDYGCTISLPHYVFNQICMMPEAKLVSYEPDYWGGLQDTFVVRRHPGTLDAGAAELDRRQHEIDALTKQVAALRSSTSWRLTRPLRALRTWTGAPPG